MRVETPATLQEALELMASAENPPTPVAGGTDLLVCWHHQRKTDLHLLDLSRIRHELQDIRMTDGHLELGGLATFWDVIASTDAQREFPLLVEAARQVGAVQIQTRGTWAGNIANASPAADGVAVLMAYDAVVILQSSAGRTETPLDRYYTAYKQTVRASNQIITAIRVPRRPRTHEWFYKVGARRAQAISKVGVAIVNDDAGWRVVATSVAPFVCRCRNLENELHRGRTYKTPGEIRKILDVDISPIDDIRSTADYRATVLSRLIFFWLKEHVS